MLLPWHIPEVTNSRSLQDLARQKTIVCGETSGKFKDSIPWKIFKFKHFQIITEVKQNISWLTWVDLTHLHHEPKATSYLSFGVYSAINAEKVFAELNTNEIQVTMLWL